MIHKMKDPKKKKKDEKEKREGKGRKEGRKRQWRRRRKHLKFKLSEENCRLELMLHSY